MALGLLDDSTIADHSRRSDGSFHCSDDLSISHRGAMAGVSSADEIVPGPSSEDGRGAPGMAVGANSHSCFNTLTREPPMIAAVSPIESARTSIGFSSWMARL